MIDERYGFPPDFDFRDIEDENQIQYGPNGEMLSGAAAITTGATDAQIEAAAERLFNFRMTGDANTSHRTGNAPTWKIVSRRKYEAPIREAADFLVATDHRIVRVDDLRALANAMIALRTEWVSANINRHIDRMEGEIKSSQLDELIEAKTNQWNELFPDRVALIDRMTALIGEAE